MSSLHYPRSFYRTTVVTHCTTYYSKLLYLVLCFIIALISVEDTANNLNSFYVIQNLIRQTLTHSPIFTTIKVVSSDHLLNPNLYLNILR